MSSSSDEIKSGAKKQGEQPQQQQQGQGQPTFSILPHPAKTNDPRDLQGGSGLQPNDPLQAFNTPGPYIPSQALQAGVEPPKSRDELRARSAELNKSK